MQTTFVAIGGLWVNIASYLFVFDISPAAMEIEPQLSLI